MNCEACLKRHECELFRANLARRQWAEAPIVRRVAVPVLLDAGDEPATLPGVWNEHSGHKEA